MVTRGNNVFGSITSNSFSQFANSFLGVNDIIIHALHLRIALSDGQSIEFQTKYDKETDTVELIIPDNLIEYFNQLTGIYKGQNFEAFINWLIGKDDIISDAVSEVNPGFYDVIQITTDTILNSSHENILCDATGGSITITLPEPSSIAGKQYTIKKIDNTGNNVIIDGGLTTIDNDNNKILPDQYNSVRIITDGNEWWVL